MPWEYLLLHIELIEIKYLIGISNKLKLKVQNSNMTDILIAKISNTFETYTQNIRPFLSGVLNHVHGIENLDKTTLTGLLEQATDHTRVFQQSFDVNGYNLLKFYTQDNRLINLSIDMNCS